MHRLLITLTILTVVIAAPALAQQAPPTRVGRVSFVSGNLAFHTAGQTEWSAAAVKYPVATGASLWTDAEARAEIRIGPDTVDMASNTELDVVALDERVTRFEVPQGRIYLHLRRLDQGQSVEIDIPRGAVQLLQRAITTSMPGPRISRRARGVWRQRGLSATAPTLPSKPAMSRC
jgi:hypothetical protein